MYPSYSFSPSYNENDINPTSLSSQSDNFYYIDNNVTPSPTDHQHLYYSNPQNSINQQQYPFYDHHQQQYQFHDHYQQQHQQYQHYQHQQEYQQEYQQYDLQQQVNPESDKENSNQNYENYKNECETSSFASILNEQEKTRRKIKAEKKPRKPKIVFTEFQLKILEGSFEITRYPDKWVRHELANELGLDDERINTWFKNRRGKYKKNKSVGIELLADKDNYEAGNKMFENNPNFMNLITNELPQELDLYSRRADMTPPTVNTDFVSPFLQETQFFYPASSSTSPDQSQSN